MTFRYNRNEFHDHIVKKKAAEVIVFQTNKKNIGGEFIRIHREKDRATESRRVWPSIGVYVYC